MAIQRPRPLELTDARHEPWREAFRQASEALRTGNIAVGACASTPDGEIVYSAPNCVIDRQGPPGK